MYIEFFPRRIQIKKERAFVHENIPTVPRQQTPINTFYDMLYIVERV